MSEIIVNALVAEQSRAADEIRSGLRRVGLMENPNSCDGLPYYQRAETAIDLLQERLDHFDAVTDELQKAKDAQIRAANEKRNSGADS